MTQSRRRRDRRDATRIRPFQGRTLLGACFPGALSPATLSLTFGEAAEGSGGTSW